MDRVDPILALLLTPFIFTCLLLIAGGIAIAAYDARQRRARRIAKARAEENRKTLAYLHETYLPQRIAELERDLRTGEAS